VELQEFPKRQVKHNQRKKCWLRKDHIEERQQITCSDEDRDDLSLFYFPLTRKVFITFVLKPVPRKSQDSVSSSSHLPTWVGSDMLRPVKGRTDVCFWRRRHPETVTTGYVTVDGWGVRDTYIQPRTDDGRGSTWTHRCPSSVHCILDRTVYHSILDRFSDSMLFIMKRWREVTRRPILYMSFGAMKN
jgi:hypothetical protein